MPRRKASERAFAKALSLWIAPEGAGEARVCIASTFTFNASFFETECLGRFLGMDAHPSESETVSYIVEREEKLAAARIAVLADRRHAREKESLRWDVLGVIAPNGAIQHSKVSLLAWTNHVRVIVGSGNLTEPGYRKNLEVFGTIELSRQKGGDRDAVLQVVDFLKELLKVSVGSAAVGAPKARVGAALQSVRDLIEGWPEREQANPKLVLGGPERSVLPQLKAMWGSSSPPRHAYVVSPFFDTGGSEAAGALLKVLAKREHLEICFDVRAEDQLDGRTRVFAPKAMIDLAACKSDVRVRRVLAEQAGEMRDLHAKMIYVQNEERAALLAGSSNFTRAGLGAGEGGANFEANLVYRLRFSEPDSKVLNEIWPETGDALDIESSALIWDPKPEAEEEGGAAVLPLPAAFQEATFAPGAPPSLVISLVDPLPSEWTVCIPGSSRILASSKDSGVGEHVLPWGSEAPPFVLEVTWRHSKDMATADWPVNVSNPAKLPPPEALLSLTLEELLQILASTRPMPQAVAEVLAKRKAQGEQVNASLDPLRRFESQTFLLRRTKRLSAALERMRERLEKPASSREAFEWRLFGPVGPIALADGYARESIIPGEAKFCIAEIALSLRRVNAERTSAMGLSGEVIDELIGKAVDTLMQRSAGVSSQPAIDDYVNAAFKEAAR